MNARRLTGALAVDLDGSMRQHSRGSPSPALMPGALAAQPALPLGPKQQVLHARRLARPGTTGARDAASSAGRHYATQDRGVSVVMRGIGRGLFVERTQRRPLGTHLVQALVFDDGAAFERWCDADPLRFDDPGLHQRLLRDGREYFNGAA